jgi:hypothetical protein
LRIVKSSNAANAASGATSFNSAGQLVFTGSGAAIAGTLDALGLTAANVLTENVASGGAINLRINGTNEISIIQNKVSNLFGIAAAGLGIPGIYASYSTITNIAAVTNAINYTPPASAGRYRISWVVNVQSNTTDSFSVTATWKDAGGTARTQALGGFAPNGSSLATGLITNVIGVGVYYGSAFINIDNSATAITVSTVGTFTTVSYDFSATLEQLA